MAKKRDRWESSSSEGEDERASSAASNRLQQAHHNEEELAGHPNASSAPAITTTQILHNPLLDGCRSVYDTYERVGRVSEGSYGVVWKAKDVVTGEMVALKQVKFDTAGPGSAGFTAVTGSGAHEELLIASDGFPVTALREISVLLALSHPSIVSVREMVVGDALDQVYMVMEYFEFDLKGGLSRFEGALAQSELKGIMQQVLAGAHHMHSHWYLHRDLKTSNILVHRSGRIALADFGLARRYQIPPRQLTQLVVTLWYRAPELLLGETRYGPPIDMWSIGCIFGELICKEAILQGQGELDQVDQIFSLVGVPNASNWPLFEQLPNAGLFRWKSKKQEELLLPKKFPVARPVTSPNQAFLDGDGYDLLSKLLLLDPAQRLTAHLAMEHPYFQRGVLPQTPRFFSSS